MSNENRGYSLLHPLYLDVPMMVSFLAHLEGGVVLEEKQTTKQTGARERLLKGRAGLRLRLGPIGGGDIDSEGSTQRREEDSLESEVSRHHTAASLFNLLYDYLVEDEQLLTLDQASDLNALRTGQLIELAGEYLGNPLEEGLALINLMVPYLDAQDEAEKPADHKPRQQPPRKQNRRSQTPASPNPEAAELAQLAELVQAAQDQEAKAQKFGMQLLKQMAVDIANVPVHDVLIKTEGGLNAVLTVDSNFYSRTTNEYLRAGDFRVVGKVTRVLTGGTLINLTRRTVMGATGPQSAREIVSSLNESGLNLGVPDPIVEAPAVQVLPMVIFI